MNKIELIGMVLTPNGLGLIVQVGICLNHQW